MDNDFEQLERARSEVNILIQQRRLANARQILDKTLPAHPDDEQLLTASAWIDWMEDNLEAAEATLAGVLSSQPESVGARHLLSRIREEQTRYADAEELLIGLLREFPEDPDFLSEYSLLMLKTLNVDKAGRLAEEALRHAPSHRGALRASVLHRTVTTDDKGASEQLAQLLREHPEDVNTTILLIQMLEEKGQSGAALRLSQQLVAASPDNEAYVEMTKAFTAQAHCTMLPMRPAVKFGWGWSIAVWVAAIIGLRLLEDTPIQLPFIAIVLTYVVYSWVWPSIIRRWMSR